MLLRGVSVLEVSGYEERGIVDVVVTVASMSGDDKTALEDGVTA